MKALKEAAEIHGYWHDKRKHRGPEWSACIPFHQEIKHKVERDEAVSEIYASMIKRGFTLHVESLRQYIKRHIGQPRTKWANQYTTTNKCKRGHDWTDNNTGWTNSVGRNTVRYCKYCQRRRVNGKSRGLLEKAQR
jgi:hypothetical protein